MAAACFRCTSFRSSPGSNRLPESGHDSRAPRCSHPAAVGAVGVGPCGNAGGGTYLCVGGGGAGRGGKRGGGTYLCVGGSEARRRDSNGFTAGFGLYFVLVRPF